MDGRGQQVIISLIARRSRLHPGTRYLARGLNSAFSTGRISAFHDLHSDTIVVY